MRKKRVTCLVFLLLSLFGCSGVTVQYDYDSAADFSLLHSFAFRDATVQNDVLADDPLLKKRVIRSVEQALTARGYIKNAQPSLPDMYIVLHAHKQEKKRTTGWYVPGFSYGVGRNGYSFGVSHFWGSRSYDQNYTEDVLVIDVLAAKTNELIWRGSGTRNFRQYDNHEEMQHALDTYVAEIVKNFPPDNET